MADLRINVSDLARDNQNRNANATETAMARIERLEEDNQALRRLIASILVILENSGLSTVDTATTPVA